MPRALDERPFLRANCLQRMSASVIGNWCFVSRASFDEVMDPIFLGRACTHIVHVGDRVDFTCGGDLPLYARAVIVEVRLPDPGVPNGEVHMELMHSVVRGRRVEPSSEAA